MNIIYECEFVKCSELIKGCLCIIHWHLLDVFGPAQLHFPSLHRRCACKVADCPNFFISGLFHHKIK